MKTSILIRTGAVALAGVLSFAPVQAEDKHVQFTPDALQWAAAPASLPKGAEAVVLFGDPAAEGQFALRLRFQDGYHVPPHTHPALENITVISGTLHLGMGAMEGDDDAVHILPAGSFVSMPAGSAHHVRAEGETIVQLHTIGPWGLTYVDPADDPRKTN